MNIKLYTTVLLISSLPVFSQVPEEALRLSWYHPNGTARNMAIGGAMVSLGGDATANHINPAGLAFFKTSDFVLTPAYQFGKEKGIFRSNSSTAASQNGLGLGTSGFVFGGFGNRAKNAVGITVTRVANFKQQVFYQGQNNYSSFAEPLADEFAFSGLTIDQALNSSNISLQTKMALYTYLVDTANGQVIARSENPGNREQQNRIDTKGGITEIALGFGSEVNKKFMFGASLGFPIVSLDRTTFYNESDATGDLDNDFSFLSYHEDFSLRGIGVNIKGSLIFRPKEYIRLGIAVHTPSWMFLKENFNSGFAADLELFDAPNTGYDSVASSVFTGGTIVENQYSVTTPVKIMISGSYVFREEEKIERQRGFITADIEYTNYKWMQFAPYDENTPSDIFKPQNDAIDALYKGAFNFRVGGELKFKVVMARLGFAYYGSPYKESELKVRKMNLSGGLGYRNKGVFVDLTYVHHLNKDVNFPYRVNAPRANTFASLKDSGGNVLLTIGFKI